MTHLNRRTVLKGSGAAGLAMAGGLSWTAPAHAEPCGRLLDTIVFGDGDSEADHGFDAELATAAEGGLGQSARVLDCREPAEYWGGTMAFTLAVAERGTTYLSVKFFGEDYADAEHEWRLQVFIGGEVLGWLDQGPVDGIDQMSMHPRRIDGFFVHTLPLPEFLTEGRESLEIEIRAMGRIYAYGGPTGFFRPMTTPSRGVYRAYTHTAPYFRPADDDDFGHSPTPTTRAGTDSQRIAEVRRRVLDDQNALLYAVNMHGLDAWGYTTLAEGYHWEDGPAYQDPRALSRVCEAIDGQYVAWQHDDTVLTGSAQQWQGFGRVGLVLCTLWDDLQAELDKPVTTGSTTVPNPGFEAGLAGWRQAIWRGSGESAADTATAHGGTGSARVSADVDSTVGINIADGRILIGQGPHRYGVWCRTEDVTSPGAYLDVIFYDDAGRIVHGDQKFYAATGTHDWEPITAELVTPEDATQLRLDLRVEGGGTAWFDDVSVEALEGSTPPAAPDMPSRRDAYREMLLASRDYWRQHQRHYTNQVQICSIGIYQANRGLRLLAPDEAWPEDKALGYLYQAVGLDPLHGPEHENGTPMWLLGHDYRTVTPKGLTRELGYVGTYGEVTDWLIAIWESVTTGPHGYRDERLREQILKIIRTRGWFRHPGVDEEGHRAMRLEQMIGWRNEHYPGDMVYAQRTAWDGHPLEAVATFEDPQLTGWAQQMVDDGQLAPQLDLLVSDDSRRVGLNAFHFVARDLPVFERLEASPHRLPGGWDRPDFVFTDETAGAIAIKRGEELLYASLYWRARQAVNDWARVHLITPQWEQSGTVRERTRFADDPTGVWTIQDWVTTDAAINDSHESCGFAGGGYPPPGEALHQVYAGRRLPIAPVPADMDPTLGCPDTLGIDSVGVGMAPFYELRYAGYIVAMNTTVDTAFDFKSGSTGIGTDLVTGERVALARRVEVAPQTTLVWFDPSARD